MKGKNMLGSYQKVTVMDKDMTRVMGALHVALGAAIIVGGERRFPPPSYQPLLDASDDRVWIYGLMFGASGCLMITDKYGPVIWGLLIGVVITSIFTGTFFYAVLKYESAGSTPWVAYLGYSVIDAMMLFQIKDHKGAWTRDQGGG